MSSVINTNVKALTAQGSLNAVNNRMSQAMQRLSTGLRINSSKDDAAGLAITNKMTADIRGLAVAIRNANDGLSLAQTAEGAISSINGMLQRMRELAVQSANGTSSELARKGSQLEIEQLKQEINNISARTSFNGIKLLDGSAANLILQTGSEIGQTMNLQLDSVNTSNLGVGSRPSLSAVGAREAGQTTDAVGDVEANHQLQSGDLFINGVNVGTSLADSDTLSYSGKAASAIAKVAAINAVSASTGVKAVVNETYVSGAAMTGASDDGSIEINGFSVDVTADTNGDNGVTRGRVVTAINSISSQTGVMAMDTGDDNNGVVLVAKDGRNITVNVTGFNDGAAAVGLSAGTTTGNYSLQSISGNPIVLSSSSTGDITHAGLSSGSFKANSSVVTSGQRDVYTNAYDPDDAWSAGTLKINGVAISGTDPSSDTASDVTASSSSRSNSAIAIAAAINKASKLTGVSAVVSSNVIVGTDFNAEDLTGKSLFINGVTIDLEQVASDPTDYTRGQLADLINSYTGRTGVVASDNGRGITLTASDGRNISLGTDLGTTDGLGLTGAPTDTINTGANDAGDGYTTYSTFSLVSDKQFSLTAGSTGGTVMEDIMKLTQGTFGGESNGFKVSDVDISTQEGAASALSALDAALDSVNFSQSRLGALQNRLDSAISNLSEVSRNTSESRSRILDADYATETTNLAKAQIVQQAATAMLAQANQSAQSVLSLLK